MPDAVRVPASARASDLELAIAHRIARALQDEAPGGVAPPSIREGRDPPCSRGPIGSRRIR
jgi:hypothetical protein